MNSKLLFSNDTRILNNLTKGYRRFHFNKNGFKKSKNEWFLNIMNYNQFNVDKRKKFLKMIVEANVVFISIDVIYILSKLRFSTNRVYFSFKFC